MMTYKGFTATKGPYNSCPANWWTIRTPQGYVCIQMGGTQREVKQAIDKLLSERMAS